jgi:hypothetical protein
MAATAGTWRLLARDGAMLQTGRYDVRGYFIASNRAERVT